MSTTLGSLAIKQQTEQPVGQYEFHPAADIFPMLDREAYLRLRDDIGTYCQEELIVLHEDKILDGRNRYKACCELGIEPDVAEIDPDMYVDGFDPVAYVLSKNLHRRHLRPSQLAICAARMCGLQHGSNQHAAKKEDVQICTSTNDASDAFGISARSVASARRVLNHGTAGLVRLCEADDIPVSVAADFVTTVPSKDEQAKIVIKGVAAIRKAIEKVAPTSPDVSEPIEGGFRVVSVEEADDDPQDDNEPNPATSVDAHDDDERPLPHVANNTGRTEWYTPDEYLDAARAVLGSIELDPASSEIAQQRVNAETFYTYQDDGLAQEWSGTVWMNPPYTAGLVDKFVDKLCEHISNGDVSQAVVLVNNATDTKWFQDATTHATAVCFPRGRVKFLDVDGNPKGAPLQGQAVLYFGDNVELFDSEFSQFGFCTEVSA